MKKVILKSIDGYNLNLHIFEVENPKAFIQVAHGMEEHQERYEYFAQKLNEAGYSVVTANMRGHGDDAPTLGFFSEKEGYKFLVEDQKLITKYIKETYNVDKVVLFAHSMGTIISRNVMFTYTNNFSKVILSGYPCPQPAAGMGIALASIVKCFRGAKYKSAFLENLAIGGYSKAIKDAKTPFDWLSENEENVKTYMEDKYCGHGFTVSALIDLFTLVKNMANYKNYTDVNANMPILLVSGKDDPCPGYEKGRAKSKEILEKAGFKDISVITYDHMRHEMLNELDKDKVIKDIVEFLDK